MNHVLVVEDDKEIREGVEIYLKSQGYEVFQAADGVEGLEVIEKEDIHLAIVDIMMPRMDGISMVVKLREKYDFPVIDRRQRRLKVMRDIRYQFGLHTLAFYFLIYRLLESALDLLDFFFKWLEYTQILIDFYIQIAICNLICRFQKSVIIPFHLIKIFF